MLGGRRIKFYNELAIPADSFARAVAFAMSQPEDVGVNEKFSSAPHAGPLGRGKAARDWTFWVRVGNVLHSNFRSRDGFASAMKEHIKDLSPMKIHSPPRKALLVHSIAFAVLVSLAMQGQAQQNPVAEREKQVNRSDRAEDKLHELFRTAQLSGADLDPEFFEIMKRFTYGEIYYQGSLDRRQRELIALVVLTTIQCLSEVRAHVGAALNIGVTPIEIKESLYQCAPFIGFPRVQEALKIVNEVMLSRGISLPLESQRQIEEGDRFVKGGEIQFPIYGDRIKQAVGNLPEEQRESIPKVPY